MAGVFRCGCDVTRRVRWLQEELEGRRKAWPTQADRRRPGRGSPIRDSKTGAKGRLQDQGAWKRSWKGGRAGLRGAFIPEASEQMSEDNLFLSKNRLQ